MSLLLSLGSVSSEVQFFNPHDLPGPMCQQPSMRVSCGGCASVGRDASAVSLPLYLLWVLLVPPLPVYFTRKQAQKD